jgi:hypothetical protein
MYDSRNKISLMTKIRYNSVAAHGTHSKSHDANDHEDVFVDQLAVQLFSCTLSTMIDVVVLQWNAVQGKEGINDASQVLAPCPQPLPHLLQENCQPSLTRNSLSSLINGVPYLGTDVSPKLMPTKKGQLTSCDTNEQGYDFFSRSKKRLKSFFKDTCSLK